MRVVCVSDTHGIHERMPDAIPDGDLLLHAGDITRRGNIEDLSEVNEFFAALPHTHKVFVPGNHDWCFEKSPERACELVSEATCLIDESIEIEGMTIWGSPWQPEFHNWAFNLPRGPKLKAVWQMIPVDTDIVITHSPPRGILDLCSNGRFEGCDDLRDRIFEVRPRLHLFGHIHESYGSEIREGIRFINASVCNQGYRPVNPPIIVDLAESGFDTAGVDP